LDRIDADTCGRIWEELLQGVLKRDGISLESICYDGTNFYTFLKRVTQQSAPLVPYTVVADEQGPPRPQHA
jgi:hypothetical protein